MAESCSIGRATRSSPSPSRRIPNSVPVFRGRHDLSPTGHQHDDVHPDGRGFAVIDLGEDADPHELRFVLDWEDELKRRVPGGS